MPSSPLFKALPFLGVALLSAGCGRKESAKSEAASASASVVASASASATPSDGLMRRPPSGLTPPPWVDPRMHRPRHIPLEPTPSSSASK